MIIIDASPCLNFMATNQQNILIQWAASSRATLAVPERVDLEIQGMCRNSRFLRSGADRRWADLKTGQHVVVLDDDIVADNRLATAVARIAGMPAAERVKQKPSLGEIMAIAHAAIRAEDGEEVILFIDDRDGRRRAEREISRLDERNVTGQIMLVSTPAVLRKAARGEGWIRGGQSADEVYNSMRAFDDGLRRLDGRTLNP